MTFQERLTAWYNTKIVAAWYRSMAVIAGWLASGVAIGPDVLQFLIDNWTNTSVLIPKLSMEGKLVLYAVVTILIQPALRAYRQKSMQEAAAKQAAARGEIGLAIAIQQSVADATRSADAKGG